MPAGDRDARETTEAYLQSVAVVMTDLLQRAIEELPLVPREWEEASTFSDWVIKLTPRRARALMEALSEMTSDTEPDEDDETAEEFVVQLATYPYPGGSAGAS